MQPPASSSPHIRFEAGDGVLDLIIDRPERKNALSRAMYSALVQGMEFAAAEPAVRVLRIRGAGGTFTSGNDLRDFQEGGFALDGGPVGAFLAALVGFEKPLVAAVSGHAIGIGTTMLLHCDLVVAADTTTFRMPFVSLGLVPEAGSSLLLPAMVGHRKAARLLMLAEPFDAATALDCGIVGEVLPESAVEPRLDELSRTLVHLPAGALRQTKKMMKAAQREPLMAAMAVEGQEFLSRLGSPEAMEAFMAFFQKRAPDFRSID